jgi:hypothetical protein
MIGDISHPCFRAFPLFDAVICDRYNYTIILILIINNIIAAPYGVREDPRTCRRDELFLK